MYRVSIELYNTSGSLGEREMLWEHEPQASGSTAFSSSPKLSRKHREEKKENNLLTLIIKMKILFAHAISALVLSPSSYTNTIFNQSACFLIIYIKGKSYSPISIKPIVHWLIFLQLTKWHQQREKYSVAKILLLSLFERVISSFFLCATFHGQSRPIIYPSIGVKSLKSYFLAGVK